MDQRADVMVGDARDVVNESGIKNVNQLAFHDKVSVDHGGANANNDGT